MAREAAVIELAARMKASVTSYFTDSTFDVELERIRAFGQNDCDFCEWLKLSSEIIRCTREELIPLLPPGTVAAHDRDS